MQQYTLEQFGFKFGRNGPHAARTMMLRDVSLLFERVPIDAPKRAYQSAILDTNLFNKPSWKARELTVRHLVDLYSLDPSTPIFRVLRRLWAADSEGRGLLALMLAFARDPLFRESWICISSKKPGESVRRGEVEALLESQAPGRFSNASLKSFAQNINGTWTQAGFLTGRTTKVRAVPVATPCDFAYAAFLAHLEGFRGQRLMHSRWIQLLDRPGDRVVELGIAASRRGLLVFMHAGGVTEVRFPNYLAADEEALLDECCEPVS